MLYNTQFFYANYGQLLADGKKLRFDISDEDIEKVKSLKYFDVSSGYYNGVPMLSWRLIDNPQISSKEELSRLFVVMQFATMLGEVNSDLYKKHNLQTYHIKLLRSLYLELEIPSGDNFEITMGYKRPFGNSDILWDIKTIIHRELGLSIDDVEESDYQEEIKVFKEFVEFLKDFFTNFEINFKNFIYTRLDGSSIFHPKIVSEDIKNNSVKIIDWFTIPNFHGEHPYLRDWTLDPSVIRDEKLKLLIDV